MSHSKLNSCNLTYSHDIIPAATFAVNKDIAINYFMILWSSKCNANSLGVCSLGRVIRVLLD